MCMTALRRPHEYGTCKKIIDMEPLNRVHTS